MRPFGSWRDNFHAGLIAKVIADVNRPPNRPPYQLKDFFYLDAEDAAEARKQKDRETFESIFSFVNRKKDGN